MHRGGSYIKAIELAGFDRIVADAGGDARALLEEAGLPVAALSDVDMLISHRKVATLYEIAARQLNRPSFCIDWAISTPEHFANLGPLLFLARFEKTMRGWFDSAARYWSFHTNGSHPSLHPGPTPDIAILRFTVDSYAPSTRQLVEHALANICIITRHVADLPGKDPIAVRFQHSRPTDTSRHDQIFRCPLEFDADHSEILFDRDLLAHRIPGDLAFLKRLMNFYVRHRIDQMAVYDQSMATTVALAIPSLLGSGRCHIGTIAVSPDINVKKLQRLLVAEGTTFSEILEGVRERQARRLLAESDAPVARIAGLLDYSTTAPFTQAFKRWTGLSPAAFRAERRKEGAAGISDETD